MEKSNDSLIQTIVPVSPLLRQHIVCFYLFTGEPGSHFRYLAFPHAHTGLSFFLGAAISRKDWSVEIAEGPEASVHIEVLGKYTRPLFIAYSGKVQEISIVFRPMGMNRFLRSSYQSIAPEYSQALLLESWSRFGETLFSGEGDIERLESFLLSQFSDNTELQRFDAAVRLLETAGEEMPVAAIAAQSGYQLKTFQRHFKKHMGCSPVEYRRICRFRNALSGKLSQEQLKTFTDLTYEGGYSDQSHFIREFRKLTTHNPKDFFRVAKKVDGAGIVWEIR